MRNIVNTDWKIPTELPVRVNQVLGIVKRPPWDAENRRKKARMPPNKATKGITHLTLAGGSSPCKLPPPRHDVI